MTITLATPADLDAALALVARHREFLARAVGAGECFVARDGGAGAIIGLVTLDRSFFGQPFISLLFVREEHRRRGVGAGLMRHAEALVTSGKLFTSTNASNTPMQRLCEKLGYMRSGWIENLDPGDPEVIYFKRVSGPAK